MPMPRFFFGTNTKMFQTHEESLQFVRDLQCELGRTDGAQLFLIPPYTSLAGLPDVAHETGIWIGAQNMHEAPMGEYTGEISAPMLTALGVDLVLLGHAERRQLFSETDAALRRKTALGLRSGLKVLLCVGETNEEKECHLEAETVARQLKVALHDVRQEDLSQVLIAYEPIWSIGEHGHAAALSDVAQTLAHIRHALFERFGTVADDLPVLYGGSVDPDNCAEYVRLEGINGLFVGRAARTARGFIEVFQRAFSGWLSHRMH